jgi:xanthine dehydrogenase molybdopterin-binding subunit B
MQVEINLLTGEITIIRSDLVYDCGESLNPAIDLGQVWSVFFIQVISKVISFIAYIYI